MKNETNEKIARDAAEKIHWHHVKKPDAYSQEEAARTSKIILAAIERAKDIKTTEYAKGWDDHVAAVKATQPHRSEDKCKCGHSRQGHMWKGTGCAVTDCDCSEFQPASGAASRRPAAVGGTAAEREHRKLVDAVLDNRMLQLRKCETELAAERETIEMLHRQRQAAERQRDSVIRQADAERERRKPLAEANLRLVEALELARKWLPNSRCPTPNEERAYEIIDAALALATRHDEQAVSPSDGGQAKEQP